MEQVAGRVELVPLEAELLRVPLQEVPLVQPEVPPPEVLEVQEQQAELAGQVVLERPD